MLGQVGQVLGSIGIVFLVTLELDREPVVVERGEDGLEGCEEQGGADALLNSEALALELDALCQCRIGQSAGLPCAVEVSAVYSSSTTNLRPLASTATHSTA